MAGAKFARPGAGRSGHISLCVSFLRTFSRGLTVINIYHTTQLFLKDKETHSF